MCELFAMSSRVPTAVTFSLDELARHGGLNGSLEDGWGIAYYDDGDARLVREAEPVSNSACLRFVREQQRSSNAVIAHIRTATQGERALKNSQPFGRELGGRMHVFAHNGKLAGLAGHPDLELGHYRPIGTTDSELAFCALLRRLEDLWLSAGTPSIDDRLAGVSAFAESIRALGPANFIYSDSEVIFAHGHRRTQSDGHVRPPGLFSLCRSCALGGRPPDPVGVSIGTSGEAQEVVLVASVPLTDEQWEPVAEGEVICMAAGGILRLGQGGALRGQAPDASG